MAIGLACAALAGCESTTRDPEFASMAETNIVPKSSPSNIIATFKNICLAGSLAEKQTRLRKAEYIEKRDLGRGVSTYVVDNSNPAVMLFGNSACGVAAEARTGQSNRYTDYVAETFPMARAFNPKTIGPRAESAWITPKGDVIWLERHGPKVAPPRVIFAIRQAKAET